MSNTQKHKLIVAVTGATGAIYARLLFDKLIALHDQIDDVAVVFSDTARDVWQYELGDSGFESLPFRSYAPDNFYAPFASGSSRYYSMIIIPCTMGTMGRIAGGISNDLITRAADVMLKERRKLILVTRETPLSLIHINNMKTITEAGGIICPASPSFYSKSKSIDQLAMTVVDRALDLAGLNIDTYRWSENQE
ncbi:MAG: UbiX family flavin prenyltransferase [Bacteroidetes bacterium]|nr:UbiX family flavin prenyltransferase [Bacteroidota bacterium]MBU1717933.1 UbiX family flavin prenyltransferase [Bacteroidota bacterium]